MIQADLIVDAKGLACPMPIVKTKKAMKELEQGSVMEVQATDKGSTADIKAWAESSGHQYLGTTEKDGMLAHYLRKSDGQEKEEMSHPHVASNEELETALSNRAEVIVLDVREAAEFAFGHIPGAQSLPLGEIDIALSDLDKEASIYVVCRSGSRSDMASQKLSAAGFKDVKNVVPGMSGWNGPIEKSVQ
ncbi:sulfurtransferase TusA family protein [Sporosarcina luteola]|uniref:sulfurtransferase TusA family protein n=1 Tax=Sporosarcina luteola TaxID=582850 RepID=UPI00203D4B44|nr:sulfurtransferase TusA family protein [Sporosarcina luteola]MCM3744432.1 sulfurtransferase TusA family protein [Sporosarcina luteola]